MVNLEPVARRTRRRKVEAFLELGLKKRKVDKGKTIDETSEEEEDVVEALSASKPVEAERKHPSEATGGSSGLSNLPSDGNADSNIESTNKVVEVSDDSESHSDDDALIVINADDAEEEDEAVLVLDKDAAAAAAAAADDDDDNEEEMDGGSSVEIINEGLDSVSEGVGSGDSEWIDLTGKKSARKEKDESDDDTYSHANLWSRINSSEAERAGSPFHREPVMKKNMEVRTMKRPRYVDEERESPRDFGYSQGNAGRGVGNISYNNGKIGSKESNDNGKKKKRKQSLAQCLQARKNCDVLKILADSLLVDNGVIPVEDEAPEVFQSDSDTSIPSEFRFGAEESAFPVKSEAEEIDDLFNEMNHFLSIGKSKNRAKNLKKKLKRLKKQEEEQNKRGSNNLETLADSLGGTPEEPQETFPPLKFTFGDELTVPENSEAEKEIVELFEEMNFALTASELGSVGASDCTGLEDGIQILEDQLDEGSFCCLGKHDLKLDEQIGIVCRCCSHVEEEIRYILPDFRSDLRGKSERLWAREEDKSLFDEFENIDLGYNYLFDDNLHDHCQGTVWDLIPDVKLTMYHHQREGFEFLWNNIAGGIFIDKMQDPNSNLFGGGCIISHAPGTGKTRLTLVFLQSYVKLFPDCKPIIVAPSSMLLTWEEEFKKWKIGLPFHNLNNDELSGYENPSALGLLKRVKGQRLARQTRLAKLFSWKSSKSVLGISYRLFEQLAGEERKRNMENYEDVNVRRILLETPGLYIFDEGHTPRNDNSLMWKALTKIKSERRVILSGTPFQNNFEELYNTLCLVRPSFADKISSRYGRHIQQKQGSKRDQARQKWTSLTGSISRVSGSETGSIEELRAMIDPFVHIHKGNILQQTLPGLRHSVVVLRPEPIQKDLLDIFVEGRSNTLMTDHWVSSICVHPSLLPENVGRDAEIDRRKLEKLRLQPEVGVKTRFLMELLQLSWTMNEKVLVFGQYIEPLTCIMDQLKYKFGWREGHEVLYMDGKCEAKARQSSINAFNNPTSKIRVMLASIKACSEGINLVGASRVVLLDVAWNPSVERQAISRAYRIGQKKMVYIYHLIASGTMEEEKCYRQAKKDRLSELLFSAPDDNVIQLEDDDTEAWDDKILEELVHNKNLKSMFAKIIYQPKDTDLMENFGLIKVF